MFSFLWWIIVGFIAGALGRLFMPGRQPMTWLMTIGLGLLGSIVGGFISSIIFGRAPDERGLHYGGIIMSTIGAVIVLVVYGNYKNRHPTLETSSTFPDKRL